MRTGVDSVYTYDLSPHESPSEGVVTAVATVSNRLPIAADADEDAAVLDPLATVVDPDALDVLFEPVGAKAPRTDGWVRFDYHGYVVTVHSDRRITVAAECEGGGVSV